MTYRALLIGNSVFEADASLNGLNAPVKDVARLHNALVNPTTGMFDEGNVRLVTEGTCDRILDELDDFFRSARRDDMALLYYSGHGVLDEHGQLYLCGRNTVSDRLLRTAVGNTRINEFIHNSACQRTVILLDCCSSGLFKGGAVETQLAGPGRYIISSTRGAALANDAALPTGTSLFTEYLVEGLTGGARDEDGDGYIDLREIYDYTRAQLRANTTQVPHCRFDGDGAVNMARVAKTAEERRAAVEHGWNQPTFGLGETYIAHRDVDPSERLRDERIDILNLADEALDLVAETDDEWVEATLAAGQLVVRLDPRTGINRAKVTVRDRASGSTAAVRFVVHVLPAVSPDVPKEPQARHTSTAERPAVPIAQSKGPVATVAPTPVSAVSTSPAAASPRTSQPHPAPPPSPPRIRPVGTAPGGASRSRPRRKVVIAVVTLLVVAAGICVWLVAANVSNRTAAYPAYGGVAVSAAKGWSRADGQPFTNSRDFNPPNATATPAPILRIGFIKFQAGGTIAAEADFHERAVSRNGAQIVQTSSVHFLGGDAVDIEFIAGDHNGISWRTVERLWIHDGATRLLEYTAPVAQWTGRSLPLFSQLASGTTND